MRVVCHLREIRGDRPIRELEEITGISRGYLSLYECGRAFPPDDQRAQIEDAYGAPVARWYPPEVLFLLQLDREPIVEAA